MLTIVFALLAGVCAIGWLIYWVGSAALVKWIFDKGHTPPTDEEIRSCTMYVWRKLLRIK